jgi:cell division protein FtsW (lipid II flippase)/cell division protein FtsI/penicillin-binding protein 2
LNATWLEPTGCPARREAWLLGIAFVFVLLASLALLIAPAVRAGSWHAFAAPAWPILVPAVWAAAALTLHRQLSRSHPNRDPFLLPVGLLLSGWGTLLILRLSPTYGLRQLAWLAIGALLTAAVLRLPGDLRWLRRYRYVWLAGGLSLTALTLLLGTNPAGGEERLWLGCCGFYVQPSEPLRLLLLAYLASFLADRLAFGWARRQPGLVAALVPLFLVWGLSTAVLLVQRDLGTGTLFLSLLAVMLYLTTDRWQVLVVAFILAACGAAAGYALFDVVRVRVLAWLNPWADPMGSSYQVIQGLIAYASGGLFGRGPGIGAPGLVPIAVSDYIFAAVGEEWGLAGGLALIALYAVLVQRGLRAAARNADPFRALLAGGIAAALGVQAMMILGGVLRVLPVTGITLPFLSYGGSSLLTSLIGLGLLLVVSEGDKPSRFVRPAGVVQAGMLVGWAALALAVGWWTIVRAPVLTARTDNPRRSLAERVNPRGPIVDRQGTLLAETVGPQGDYRRSYPLGSAAAAVVGYDSARFAQAGLERSRDNTLRGEEGHDALTTWWQHLTQGTPPRGLGIRITLDASLQAGVAEALSPYRGAAVLLDASTGDVLAMASSPGFDPNRLDEDWDDLTASPDAPLLNRVTQGRYQPGMVLAPLLLAQAIDAAQVSMDEAIEALSTPVQVDGQTIGCAIPPATEDPLLASPDYVAALRYGCPAPLAVLGPRLGVETFEQMVVTFGLRSVALTELDAEGAAKADLQPEWQSMASEAIGQGALDVSPLEVARAFAALRSGGMLPGLRLVEAAETPDGGWVTEGEARAASQTVTRSAAADVLQALARDGGAFSAMAASAATGTGGKRLSWFAGASAENQAGVVVVIVLENGTLADAWRIGRQALVQAAGAPGA